MGHYNHKNNKVMMHLKADVINKNIKIKWNYDAQSRKKK